MVPDMTRSPGSLRTVADSPVRMDSSISTPCCSTTTPSAGTWSPLETRMRSPRTTSATPTEVSVPSRMTWVSGAARTDRLSRARLARISATVPVAVLISSTKPNRASRQLPTARMTTRAAPRMALKTVKTLARRISRAEREVGSW